MYLVSLCILTTLASVYGDGEIIFLETPRGVEFKGHDSVSVTSLIDVYSACMGLTNEYTTSWEGMYISNPFRLSKGVVNVVVDGSIDLDFPEISKFPLWIDEDVDYAYYSLKTNVEHRNSEKNSDFVYVKLSEGKAGIKAFDSLNKIDLEYENTTYLNDPIYSNFINELALLNGIAQSVEIYGHAFRPQYDIFWIKFSGLRGIDTFIDKKSPAALEAGKLLKKTLLRLSNGFTATNDNLVFTIMINSESHIRKRRETQKSTGPQNLNLAGKYSKEYAAVFNIILWFMVVMVFSLLAICIFIATMDPGRDSIIYRMTSTRMKKDN